MAETEDDGLRKYISIFYAFLFSLGVAIYLAWGIMFGVWVDVGLYSVVAVLMGFGFFGFLLYSIEEEE